MRPETIWIMVLTFIIIAVVVAAVIFLLKAKDVLQSKAKQFEDKVDKAQRDINKRSDQFERDFADIKSRIDTLQKDADEIQKVLHKFAPDQ